MPSEWKVTSQMIGDVKKYAVCRTINTKVLDHSGNREYATGYLNDRECVAAIAEKLNQGGNIDEVTAKYM